jgi:hypothetical protein
MGSPWQIPAPSQAQFADVTTLQQQKRRNRRDSTGFMYRADAAQAEEVAAQAKQNLNGQRDVVTPPEYEHSTFYDMHCPYYSKLEGKDGKDVDWKDKADFFCHKLPEIVRILGSAEAYMAPYPSQDQDYALPPLVHETTLRSMYPKTAWTTRKYISEFTVQYPGRPARGRILLRHKLPAAEFHAKLIAMAQTELEERRTSDKLAEMFFNRRRCKKEKLWMLYGW